MSGRFSQKSIQSVPKPVRQHHRRHQTPPKNPIAHPRTHNLHPTGPVGPPHGREIARVLEVDILRQEGGHPASRQHEDHVEQAVIVLSPEFLIILAAPAIAHPVHRIIIIIVVVERVGRQGPGLDGGTEGFGAHLPARGRGLLVDEAVLGVVGADFAVRVARVAAERDPLRGGAGGGVGDGEHGEHRTEDDGGGAGAAGPDQRVAVVVVGLHAHGGHGEVGAVDGDDGGLGEAGLGVVFLDGRVD